MALVSCREPQAIIMLQPARPARPANDDEMRPRTPSHVVDSHASLPQTLVQRIACQDAATCHYQIMGTELPRKLICTNNISAFDDNANLGSWRSKRKNNSTPIVQTYMTLVPTHLHVLQRPSAFLASSTDFGRGWPHRHRKGGGSACRLSTGQDRKISHPHKGSPGSRSKSGDLPWRLHRSVTSPCAKSLRPDQLWVDSPTPWWGDSLTHGLHRGEGMVADQWTNSCLAYTWPR